MTDPYKMLVIYVDETDLWETRPLYEAIVRRLRQLGVAGATVQTGIMGFGTQRKVHRKRLFGISDDKPVVITVLDTVTVMQQILPEIRKMVKEGLVFLLDAEVVAPSAES